jgi:P-type conjugative transfer protein TrbJ
VNPTRMSWLVALAAMLVVLRPSPAASMPVFDAGNFAQNLVTAIEAVDQTLTQILEYQNQLAQYEEIVRNGLAPAVYTWDRLVSIHDKLNTLASALRNWRHWLRDLDDYLRRFADLDYYRSARCYGSDLSCPQSEWDRILSESMDLHGLASESQKKTLDHLLRALDSSETDLVDESENLARLQRQSESAEGQMQAIQAGNQLASAQAHQLMQMRAIMVAQYRAAAMEALASQSISAQERAARERFLKPGAKDSPPAHWDSWPRGARW